MHGPLRFHWVFRKLAWSALAGPALAAVVVLALAGAGCKPRAIGPGGVIGCFGGVGLGPGDFSYPRAITAEPRADGSIFVIDKAGRVQRFNTKGEYELSWKMPLTELGKPVGLSVHPDGRVFIADTHYARVMIYDRDGELLDSFGESGTGPGQLTLPTDVAFDAQGYIYVSQYHEADRITKWSPQLAYVGALGVEPINGEPLRRPSAIVVDDEQTLWVADACNHRLIRFSLDGEVLSWFGEFGKEPGQLRYPYDLCVTPEGTLLVCEYEGNRLQWFDKQGQSLRTWGVSGRGLGELNAPWGVTLGPRGHYVFVLDSLNSRVQVVAP